jgi:transcriptional regulator GlxA family with amidase domain
MKFGIFIYPDVEPIDLATFGVLSMARRIRPEIELCTIAPRAGEVKLTNGLRVIADYDLASAPPLDVLVVTGGPGWQAESRRPKTLSFFAAAGGGEPHRLGLYGRHDPRRKRPSRRQGRNDEE